jgi:hypothetical protein
VTAPATRDGIDLCPLICAIVESASKSFEA